MPQKRTSAEAELMPIRTRRETSKRTRLSPTAEMPSDSSVASTGSISEDSALQSTPGLSEDNRQSSLSSISDQDENDSDSSMSESSSDDSSSDEEEEDEEDEEDIITLGGPKKPEIDPKRVLEEASKLQSRLKELLPKLRHANDELAEKGPGLSMEDVDDGEQHIEMNLGLGVLEEQQDSEDEDALVESQKVNHATRNPDGEPSAMQDLLGAQKDHSRPGIEELDGV